MVALFFENLWRLDLELFVEYCRELRNCKAVYTEALDELFATLLIVFTNKDRAVNIPAQVSFINEPRCNEPIILIITKYYATDTYCNGTTILLASKYKK